MLRVFAVETRLLPDQVPRCGKTTMFPARARARHAFLPFFSLSFSVCVSVAYFSNVSNSGSGEELSLSARRRRKKNFICIEITNYKFHKKILINLGRERRAREHAGFLGTNARALLSEGNLSRCAFDTTPITGIIDSHPRSSCSAPELCISREKHDLANARSPVFGGGGGGGSVAAKTLIV